MDGSMKMPTMAPLSLLTYNKYMSRLDGRDKVLRLVQYFTRFIVYTFLNGGDSTKDSKKKFTELYKAIGLHRKAFKLGSSFDEYEKFMEALSDPKLAENPQEQNLTLTLRAAMVIFGILDNLTWFASIKVLEEVDKEMIKLRANQFRLVAALANLSLNLVSIGSTQKKIEKSLKNTVISGGSASQDPSKNNNKTELDKIREKQTLNVLKFAKNAMDVLVRDLRLFQ
jgi:hypothetical protein